MTLNPRIGIAPQGIAHQEHTSVEESLGLVGIPPKGKVAGGRGDKGEGGRELFFLFSY